MRPAAVRGKKIQAGGDKCQVFEGHLVCLRHSTKAVWLEQGGQGETSGGRSPREGSQTNDGPGSHGSTLDFTEGGGEILKGFSGVTF